MCCRAIWTSPSMALPAMKEGVALGEKYARPRGVKQREAAFSAAPVGPVIVVQIPSSDSIEYTLVPFRSTPSMRIDVAPPPVQTVGDPQVVMGEPRGRIPTGGATVTCPS